MFRPVASPFFHDSSPPQRAARWLGALGSLGLFAALGLGCLGGCAQTRPETGSAVVADDRGLPCNVADVLDRKCRACHERKPSFGAPMALVTRDDLLAPLPSDPTKRVIDGAIARASDVSRPMPPPTLALLTDQEKQALQSWAAAATPGACATQLVDAPGLAISTPTCTPDLPLAPSQPYEMPANRTNEYVCYRVDVNSAEPRQVVAMVPVPDNQTILHHVLLFRVDDETEAAKIGTKPAPCDAMRSMLWTFLYGWGPGTGGLELPANVGINQPKKAHYVVQLHYNNPRHLGGQRDKTGFNFCTTDKLRPFEADVMAFGTDQIYVPAKAAASVTCDYTIPDTAADGIHILAMNPHMHGAGTAIETNVLRKTGEDMFSAPATLAKIDPWNYQDQQWQPVSEVLRPGDVVRQRCAFANPTSRAITFGENTEDEMCFGFTLYYPRIKASYWNWAYPTMKSLCTNGP